MGNCNFRLNLSPVRTIMRPYGGRIRHIPSGETVLALIFGQGEAEPVDADGRNSTGTREKLILAGVEELNTYGVHNFSTRRVAKNCGISCAAPYRHFADSHAFIAEILKYINSLYYARQAKVLEQYADCDSRRQLLEVALDYIRFLAENPEFRRVIMQNYRSEDHEYRELRGKLSLPIYRVMARYCRDVNMSPETRRRKTFLVPSVIYGAAMFFDTGDLRYNEESMAMVAAMLDREFDLP